MLQPETEKYHLVRFVRGDDVLNVFDEKLPECVYEYVPATVDVSRQKLRLFLGKKLVDEHSYLRR